jgi:hypothetical protein
MFSGYVTDFTPKCTQCNAGASYVSPRGRVREDVYEVTYTWEVKAYSHDEAVDMAKKRGLDDWDGQGSRRMPHAYR